MKYYVDYKQITGEILGYLTDATVSQKQGDVLEVDFFKYNESMAFNKIIVDGKNITFEKVDWRTPKEIEEQENQIKINEAKQYLNKTDHKFYNGYKPKDGEDLVEIERLRDEAREFIRANEI